MLASGSENRFLDKILGWQGTSLYIRSQLLIAFCQGIVPQSIIYNILTIFLFLPFMSEAINPLHFAAYVILIFIPGFGIRMYAKYLLSHPELTDRPRRHALYFVVTGAVYGMIWGGGGGYFYWMGNPFDQAIMVFLITFSATIGPYAPIPGFSKVRFLGTVLPFAGSFVYFEQYKILVLICIVSIWLYKRHGYNDRYRELLSNQFDLQAELASRTSELENASAVKDEFLASMSHELRTPLNGILGMSRQLQTEGTLQENIEKAKLIESSGHVLLTVLNGILDSVQVPLDRGGINKQVFNLKQVLQETGEIMSAHSSQDTRAKVSIEIDPLVPKWVKGDSAKISHIVYNLLSNALSFSANKPVELRLKVADRSDDGAKIKFRFSIRDQGPGISSEDQQRIFQKYTRLDNQPKNRISAGLGLSIANNLVSLLGGSLQVNSQPGLGSEFSFELELERAEFKESRVEVDPSDDIQRPLSVLVVEDMKINRRVIQGFLVQAGHHVAMAETGMQAIKLFHPGIYDVVLMDINLPDIDGVTVTKDIREMDSESNNLQIIAITANVFPADRDRYLESGFDAVLGKPVMPDELNKLMLDLSSRKRATENLADFYQEELVQQNHHQQIVSALGKEEVQRLSEVYITESRKLKSNLERALKEGDLSRVKGVAHDLASCSSSMALSRAKILFNKIETAAANNRDDTVKELCQLISGTLDETLSQLSLLNSKV